MADYSDIQAARAVLAREFSDADELQRRTAAMASLLGRTKASGNGPDDPVRRMLALCGDTWASLVLMLLEPGSLRYSTLLRLTVVLGTAVSERMLTRALRHLEREGLIWRQVKPTVPPATHYGLTPLGDGLLGRIHRLVDWAEASGPAVDQARARFDALHGEKAD